MRIIFMGTPDFSVPALLALAGSGHEIVACYTQPPRPAGRGMELRKSAVQIAAENLGIAVLHPQSLRGPNEQGEFRDFNADVAVVVAYGLILPQAVLSAPRLGCYNIHASLLPRWRGAAPIQRAIMAGDTETGVTIMKMDQGLDTGDMAIREAMTIAPDMTFSQLHDALSELGSEMILRTMSALETGELALEPQPSHGVSYAAKIDKAESRIDWSQPAETVHNLIRAMSPFPGAWCEMEFQGKPERVKMLASSLCDMSTSASAGTVLDEQLAIACGKGAVRITRLQRAGKQPCDANVFLAGNRIAPGSSFT
ncbi:MAG: methionyl-tRNA formyltransferase [Nitratireductor sp.]